MLHSKRNSTVQKIMLYHQHSQKKIHCSKNHDLPSALHSRKNRFTVFITTLRSLHSRFIRINIKILCTTSSLHLRKKHPNSCTETSDHAARNFFEKTLKFCALSSLGLRKIWEFFEISYSPRFLKNPEVICTARVCYCSPTRLSRLEWFTVHITYRLGGPTDLGGPNLGGPAELGGPKMVWLV